MAGTAWTRSTAAWTLWIVAAGIAPAVSAADWPGWRGPGRDGKSPETGLLREWPAGGPKLVWKAEGIGRGFSSAAVAGGAVYVTGDKDKKLTVFAFTLDGKPAGSFDHDRSWDGGPEGSRSTPVIDGDRLYIISGHGAIGCYAARTGKPIWKRAMKEFGGDVPGWGYSESVLIYKNLAVVTPGGKNCIVALDKKTGKTVWQSSGFEAGAQYSSCIAFEHDGKPLIVNGTSEGLVCVSAKDGTLQWSNPWSAHNTANCPTPVYANGHVFWANGYGKGGICMKLEPGPNGTVGAKQAWTTDMDCHHGGYIVHEGNLYGNHGDGWACLELATGTRRWRERGVGKGSLCFADGMLFLFSENSGQAGLAAASPEGLAMKGTFKVSGNGPSWAHPVVAGGRLYLRYDTTLYCFDIKAK